MTEGRKHFAISEMKEGIATTDPMDSKRIRKEHYKQLYKHKFDHLDEVNSFLQMQTT